jgi:hypothetical protein
LETAGKDKSVKQNSMLDEGKRTENDMTWTGVLHETAGYTGRQHRKSWL